MNNKKKKILLISLSVLAVLLVLGIVLIFLLVPKELTANNYFKSLTNSNHTKQVQITKIEENNVLLYEKTETMFISGKKVYHKIETKTLSQSSETDYDLTVEEFYYFNNLIYYFENNEWKTSEFNLNNQLKSYNFKTEYFSLLNFDKKIEETGSLTGEIKNENVKDVFGSNSNLKDVSLSILVNKKVKVQSYSILGLNETNKNVSILSTYSYEQENVTLPI